MSVSGLFYSNRWPEIAESEKLFMFMPKGNQELWAQFEITFLVAVNRCNNVRTPLYSETFNFLFLVMVHEGF